MLEPRSRRDVLVQLSAITGLLGMAHGANALAGPAGREADRWIVRLDEVSAALRGGRIPVADWRSGIETLLSRVALPDVMAALDFERLQRAAGFAKVGVATAQVDFGDGAPRPLRFYPKLFAVGRGRSIIPHGHANMVSAHLTLSGRFRLRQYDQLDRQEDSLVIRPTDDRTILPGDLSSIGEDRDNVHWFVAEEPSHTFDIIVAGLDPEAERRFDIFNIDIARAVALGDGTLSVPRLGVAAALARYG